MKLLSHLLLLIRKKMLFIVGHKTAQNEMTHIQAKGLINRPVSVSCMK